MSTILNYDREMKGLVTLLMVVSLPLVAADTGYRIVHPDGTVEFTDDGAKGGKAIPLQEVPSYQSDAPSPAGGGPSANGNSKQPANGEATEESEVAYQSLTIVSPRQDETVWFNTEGFQVNVSVTPKLAEGHQVVIYLNGSEVAREGKTRLTIPAVFRGTHRLKAVIQDGSGTALISSTPITFHMRQHSVQ